MYLLRLTLLFSFLILISCKSSEEVIRVDDNPFQLVDVNNTADSTETDVDSEFLQYRIGHVQPIISLDPLFAISNAEHHTIQFIFEGITRLDENNQVQPLLARSWQYSDDSLSVTFNLRSDVYFHDSGIFSSGIGRRLRATDIVNAFKRMADIEVPAEAAKNFFNIKGFESYFLEQHYVHLESERALPSISGISVQNDSTITFTLNEADAEFLEKLAHPSAVIYPREAVNADMMLESYVGTGPFRYVRPEADKHIVLGKHSDYREPVNTNRIDIYHDQSESDLFQFFARNEIDIIPLLSPEIAETVLDTAMNLNVIYADRFRLLKSDKELNYEIYFNPDSKLSRESLAQTLINNDAFNGSILDIELLSEGNDEELPQDLTIYTTETDNPFIRSTYKMINQSFGGNIQPLKLTNIRIPFPTVSLYSSDFPYPASEAFIKISFPVLSLSNLNYSGVKTNAEPWWLDLKSVEISEDIK